MIQWLTIAQLEEALAEVPPIGLALRGFFHGRLSANLSAVFDRAPESTQVEGVGEVQTWAGAYEETPFVVSGHRRGELSSFQIALPIAIQEGQIDIRMLDVVQSLSTLFHAARNPQFSSLPFAGSGFGVFQRGSNTPLFRSQRRADADTIATYLDDRDRYEVAVVPPAPTQWIVAGPRVGSTMSRLEVVNSREEADQLATQWQTFHHHAIDVFEGQLPA